VTYADRQAPSTGHESYRVVVPGLPVDHFLQLHGHIDALLAELAAVDAADLAPRDQRRHLRALIDGLTGPFAAGRDATRVAAEDAKAHGAREFTLEMELPLAAPEAVPAFNRLLDMADSVGSRGMLRTHPASPDIVDLRRWIAAEVSRATTTAPAATN
jgi:hypothetical protein